MPRHASTREESLTAWFKKYIWEVTKRRNLLLESIEGDNRWLDDVTTSDYPSWAKNGGRRKLFRFKVKKWARQVLEDPISFDQNNRQKGAPAEQQGQGSAEDSTEGEED